MIVCYVVAICIILWYGAVCARDNRRRAAVVENTVAAEQDWLDLTDQQNTGFKYTT